MPARRSTPTAQPQVSSDEIAGRLGRRLREARQRRDESIEDIADYLRVQPAYLTALEAGDLEALPGRPYALGFLRTYGAYLGFDAQALVAEMRPAMVTVAAPTLRYREPRNEGRRATATMLVASLLLAAAVYGGYHVVAGGGQPALEQVAEAPGEVSKLAGAVLRKADDLSNPSAPGEGPRTEATVQATADPGAPAASSQAIAQPPPSPTASPALAMGGAAPTQEMMAQLGAPVPATPVVAAADPVASTPTAANASPGPASELLAAIESDRALAERDAAAGLITASTLASSTAALGHGRVTLVALESSWIQIRSSDSQFVRNRTLAAGDRFEVPDRADLALWTGNAGGLEVLVDGQSIGSAGRRGEVIKNIPLVPEELRARTLR